MDRITHLVFDVGSTFTKATGFALAGGRFDLLASGQAPTTVENIETGLAAALARLAPHVPDWDAATFASSSAAGGLRMVALGYMPKVTAKAAKEVAMNAGARVLEVLSSEDPPPYRTEVLREIRPDIILLTGGTDGGDASALEENARAVAGAAGNGWEPVVIVAGNRDAQASAETILNATGIRTRRVANILPTIHELRVRHAREAIHDQFIRQITRAPGLAKLASRVRGTVIPTPGAVLLGAELLARGTREEDGLGGLIVVDVGGATTDVHSVLPELEDLAIEERGLVISNEKQVSFRTVEGNLGMRISAGGVVEAIGARAVLAYADPAGLAAAFGRPLSGDAAEELAERLETYAARLGREPDFLAPENALEGQFDTALATAAVGVALRRHAGSLATEANPVLGLAPGMPVGRDLRQVTRVIAVGGVFAHSSPERRRGILERAFANPGLSLLPASPRFFTDDRYVLYAVGVLGQHLPDPALRFAKTLFT